MTSNLVGILVDHLRTGDPEDPYMVYVSSAGPSDLDAVGAAARKALLNGWMLKEATDASNGLLWMHPDKQGVWTLRGVCEDALGMDH